MNLDFMSKQFMINIELYKSSMDRFGKLLIENTGVQTRSGDV